MEGRTMKSKKLETGWFGLTEGQINLLNTEMQTEGEYMGSILCNGSLRFTAERIPSRFSCIDDTTFNELKRIAQRAHTRLYVYPRIGVIEFLAKCNTI